jgi:hypothetical protein
MPDTLIDARKKRGASFRVYYNAQENTYSLDTMVVILLSDIRDELQELNAHLRCSRFVGIPGTLNEIRDRLPVKRTRTPKVKAEATRG